MTPHPLSLPVLRRKSIAQDIFWISFGVIALISGSEIRIPLPWTPVPITLQTFVVVALSLALPPRRALTAIALYLLLGGVGVPIFSGWTAGLLRPTTGYLAGFFLAALALSPLREKLLAAPVWLGVPATYLINDCIICASGMVWLHFWSDIPFSQLVWAGWLPFIPGGVVKTTAAWFLARKVHC